MRIWSIQSEQAWEYLQRHSSLLARRHHRWDGCPHAYDWIGNSLSGGLARRQRAMWNHYGAGFNGPVRQENVLIFALCGITGGRKAIMS